MKVYAVKKDYDSYESAGIIILCESKKAAQTAIMRLERSIPALSNIRYYLEELSILTDKEVLQAINNERKHM